MTPDKKPGHGEKPKGSQVASKPDAKPETEKKPTGARESTKPGGTSKR
jgi:hypothetical protein